jgi:hypothetical protein
MGLLYPVAARRLPARIVALFALAMAAASLRK